MSDQDEVSYKEPFRLLMLGLAWPLWLVERSACDPLPLCASDLWLMVVLLCSFPPDLQTTDALLTRPAMGRTRSGSARWIYKTAMASIQVLMYDLNCLCLGMFNCFHNQRPLFEF